MKWLDDLTETLLKGSTFKWDDCQRLVAIAKAAQKLRKTPIGYVAEYYRAEKALDDALAGEAP